MKVEFGMMSNENMKLECRGLLKVLKKFRFWLYRRYFIVETDDRMAPGSTAE